MIAPLRVLVEMVTFAMMVILILIAMALLVLTRDCDLKFGTDCDPRQRENGWCWCSTAGAPLSVLHCWCSTVGAGAEVRVQEFPAIPPPLRLTIPPITSSDFTTGPNSNYYL